MARATGIMWGSTPLARTGSLARVLSLEKVSGSLSLLVKNGCVLMYTLEWQEHSTAGAILSQHHAESDSLWTLITLAHYLRKFPEMRYFEMRSPGGRILPLASDDDSSIVIAS